MRRPPFVTALCGVRAAVVGQSTTTSAGPGRGKCVGSWRGEAVVLQRIHLDIQVGEHAIDYQQVAAKDKLTELQLRIRQLLDQVEMITKEQNYQRVSPLPSVPLVPPPPGACGLVPPGGSGRCVRACVRVCLHADPCSGSTWRSKSASRRSTTRRSRRRRSWRNSRCSYASCSTRRRRSSASRTTRGSAPPRRPPLTPDPPAVHPVTLLPP